MRRWNTMLTALLSISTVAVPQQSQPSHEYNQTEHDISQVQRDYYAIPYAMQLTVLTDAAKIGQGRIDESTIQPETVKAESFEVSLSGITTGRTSDIQSQRFADLVSIPGPGQKVVHLSAAEPAKGDKYGFVKAVWGPMEKQPPANASTMTMEDLFTDLDDLGSATFDRYVAYQVALHYQGQSANYKAIYLFSDGNPRQHQTIDLYLSGIRYSDDPNAYRPVRILGSSWRNIPALRDWLLAHTTTDPGCSEMNNLCCVGGHCAMRRSDFDRRMSQPVIGGTDGISFSSSRSRVARAQEF